jgi:hypothetical protein
MKHLLFILTFASFNIVAFSQSLNKPLALGLVTQVVLNTGFIPMMRIHINFF